MSLTLILAVTDNNVIGLDNTLPWHYPNDMKRFVALTKGKIVVMGRKTWESIDDKYKPLKDRENWIVTHNHSYRVPEGVHLVHDLQEILKARETKEIMVMGGSELYRAMLPFADFVEMTVIHDTIEGDAFFDAHTKPNWEVGWEQTEIRHFMADERHKTPYSFVSWRARK